MIGSDPSENTDDGSNGLSSGTSNIGTSFQSPNPASTAPVTDIGSQIESSSTNEQSFESPESSSTNDDNTLNQLGTGSTSNTGSHTTEGISSMEDGSQTSAENVNGEVSAFEPDNQKAKQN